MITNVDPGEELTNGDTRSFTVSADGIPADCKDTGGEHVETKYIDILTVEYQYSQGGAPVQFTRKFLIYAKRYKKQNINVQPH
jgi:hypothetical protein